MKTKLQYQNLLNSGKIKDNRKREAVQTMLQQLDDQLEGLDDILPRDDRNRFSGKQLYESKHSKKALANQRLLKKVAGGKLTREE